jgi:hypothetical protein
MIFLLIEKLDHPGCLSAAFQATTLPAFTHDMMKLLAEIYFFYNNDSKDLADHSRVLLEYEERYFATIKAFLLDLEADLFQTGAILSNEWMESAVYHSFQRKSYRIRAE